MGILEAWAKGTVHVPQGLFGTRSDRPSAWKTCLAEARISAGISEGRNYQAAGGQTFRFFPLRNLESAQTMRARRGLAAKRQALSRGRKGEQVQAYGRSN